MEEKNKFLKENQINSTRAKKVIKKYERDKDGNIILRDGTYVISSLPTNKYNFTNGWIGRPQPDDFYREEKPVKMFLVKSYIPDKCPGIYTKTDTEILRANNFIMAEIAKQFELEAAEYYNVVFENSDELKCDENYNVQGRNKIQRIRPNVRYLITPSFKRNNEKMVHFAEILDSENQLNARQIFEQIKEYLKRENVAESDIDSVMKDYIKQCIFNKFIEFSDEHNLNAALLITDDKNGKRARIAPCYDLDFAAGIFNIVDGGHIPKVFFRYSDKGSDTLLGILAQFYSPFERRYLKEVLPKIDIEQAIEIGQRYGNFILSDMAKQRYLKFFRVQIQDLEDFYNKYCKPREKQDNIKAIEEVQCTGNSQRKKVDDVQGGEDGR